MVDEVEELINLLDTNWNEGGNFNDFTEVDAGSSIFVDSVNQITFTTVDRNEDTYVHKATTESISGDFLAQGSFKLTATSGSRWVHLFGYGDTLDVINNNSKFISIEFPAPLKISNNGVSSTETIAISVGIRYWWTFQRVGSTVTLDVYDDAERTSQVGSTITETNSDTFDRVFAFSAQNDGFTPHIASGVIYALENATGVIEVPKPTFYFTGQDVKRHDFRGVDSCLVYFVGAPANRPRGLSYTAEDSEVVMTIDFRTQRNRARMIALRDEIKRIRKEKRATHGIGIYDLLLHVRDNQVMNYTNFWHYAIDVRLVKAVEDIS